jgi:enoyl-CoA hydratase/carnithine racemase
LNISIIENRFPATANPTMPPIPPIFVLQVPPLAATAQAQQQGSFICTQAAPQVYLLSFSSPPDNRLTPAFNQAFLLALDIIEHRLPKGVVVTTSSITKFYSNGLDYENAIRDPNFFPNSLFPLWRRLIAYPMPTIALMNGHGMYLSAKAELSIVLAWISDK